MADIRHIVVIDAAPERIYPLISSALGFQKWWAADATKDSEQEDVELGFFDRSTVYRLRPIKMVEGNEAEWLCQTGAEWQAQKSHSDLSPARQARNCDSPMEAGRGRPNTFLCATRPWSELMYRLKAAAEGKALGPLFSASGLAY